MKEKATIEYLKECFEIIDDKLYWSKIRPEEHFKGNNAFKNRHFKRFAGNEAGAVKEDRPGLFYRYIKLNSRHYYAHQIIWATTYGFYATMIDHINGDGMDNSLDNMREADHTINSKNRRLSKNNKSGEIGVRQCNVTGRWVAAYMVNQHQYHLGTFEKFEDAVKAVKDARRDNGFTENHGRK